MSDFTEFQAKTLDDAISDACNYFNAERAKLEIEIIEDAKAGFFGVGARKAKIRAKKVTLSEARQSSVFSRTEIIPREEKQKQSQNAQNKEEVSEPIQKQEVSSTQNLTQSKEEKTSTHKQKENLAQKPVQKDIPSEKISEKTSNSSEDKVSHAENNQEIHDVNNFNSSNSQQSQQSPPSPPSQSPQNSFGELDHEKLLQHSKVAVEKLIKAITPEATIEAEIYDERISIIINTEETGLLIGREGQTLAAIEYLIARIVSKEVSAHVRVQVEIGDYRSRQDARLHEFALVLAEKVLSTGKPASTRQLSAYQRRIVHLALQDTAGIQTRSIGEGSAKRVVVSRLKGEKTYNQN